MSCRYIEVGRIPKRDLSANSLACSGQDEGSISKFLHVDISQGFEDSNLGCEGSLRHVSGGWNAWKVEAQDHLKVMASSFWSFHGR